MTWADAIADHRQALDTGFAVFSRTPHGSLLWLTTVISAHVVTLDDDIAEAISAEIDAYHVERSAVLKRSGRTYRNPAGWTRFCGTIEIDLIHPRIASRCSRMKAGLLAELGIDVMALRADQRVAVVHEHAVVDHRGHASADALTRDLRRAWPGARRVHAARLFETGTVAQNLSNLADYAGKFRFRYSIAWNGQRTTYLGDFEEPWRDYLRRTYRSIGFARLLNGNVATQAGRRGMHTNPPIRRAETRPPEPFQLSISQTLNEDEKLYHTNPSHHHPSMIKPSGDPMRVHEIIDNYIDKKNMSQEDYDELVGALERQGVEPMTADEMYWMYGDIEADLRVEQQRLDIARTRAEIAKLDAEALKDRSDALD